MIHFNTTFASFEKIDENIVWQHRLNGLQTYYGNKTFYDAAV
jgi:hypothetical protein